MTVRADKTTAENSERRRRMDDARVKEKHQEKEELALVANAVVNDDEGLKSSSSS